MAKKDFSNLAVEFMENNLYAPATVSYGVLSTDGKIYYSRKRSIAELIRTKGSTVDLTCDVVAVSPSNYVGDMNAGVPIYKNGNSYIRVLNKDKPVQISAA